MIVRPRVLRVHNCRISALFITISSLYQYQFTTHDLSVFLVFFLPPGLKVISHHHGAMVPFFTARFDTQRRNFHEGKNKFLLIRGTGGVRSGDRQPKCELALNVSLYRRYYVFSLLQEHGSLAVCPVPLPSPVPAWAETVQESVFCVFVWMPSHGLVA